MSENNRYFLGLGGNQGLVEQSFILAIKKLRSRLGKLEAISSLYISEALQLDYTTKQNDYLNCVVEFSSDKSEIEVFSLISELELELGRTRLDKWGPRLIDIDIIAKGESTFTATVSKSLEIPHLEMHKRSFVLIPLAEIAPNWVHPVLKKSVIKLISDLEQPTPCKILTSFPHCEF